MSINIWSILVAAIASFIIGSIWYSPILFGKQWMALTNTGAVTPEKKKGIWKLYVVQFLLSIVTMCILGFAIAAMQITSALDGATLGLLAWVGFYATFRAANLLWQPGSLKLALISAGSILLNLIVGGAIIGGWR